MRVTPQLIEVSDDRHVWAGRYDVDPADGFDAQAAVAREVSAALDLALGRGATPAMVSAPRTTAVRKLLGLG